MCVVVATLYLNIPQGIERLTSETGPVHFKFRLTILQLVILLYMHVYMYESITFILR